MTLPAPSAAEFPESKYFTITEGFGMGLLDLLKPRKVIVTVAGDVLVVTMPGTAFSVSYEKTTENQLVVSSFRKGLGTTPKVPFPNS